MADIASAQTEIKGFVTDQEDGSLLPGVLVVLKDKRKNHIVRYAQTSENGQFTLSLKSEGEKDSCFLHVSSMGYKAQEISLTGVSMPLHIRMIPSVMRLNEVAVRARKIRQQGDTIIYNVASFSDKQDKTIGDVLQKMPGITVASTGAISYNGTSINKLYIEGRDLLEGQYGIATNGISPADVGSVEILEDHQPIRALQGVSHSSQAAVNLRLKKDSKAKWIVNLVGTGGLSTRPEGGLWADETFAMRMRGSNQHITLCKGNNIGKDLSREVSDLTSQTDPMEFANYIQAGGISAPDLEKKRTLFNRSFLFTTGQLWGMKNGWEVKTQINYLNDRLKSGSISEETYYLPDVNKDIVEERKALQSNNHLFCRFTLEGNKETFYLKNNLKTNLQWNDVTIGMTGTLPHTQDASLPVYRTSNDFQLIKRFGNRLVTFYSYNDWQNRPQSVLVMQGSNYRQHTRESGFFTHEHVSYGWKIHKVTLNIKGGVKAMFRSLNSRLYNFPDTLGLPVNDLTTHYSNLYVVPKLEYKYHRWEGLFEVPMNYYRYDFVRHLPDENEWLVAPSLCIRWNMTPHFTLSVRGNIRPKECDIRNLYNGVILTDYRTLRQGMDEYSTGKSRSLSGNLTYRDATHGIFGNLMAMRSWNESDFMGSSLFVGDYIVRSYIRSPNKSEVRMVMGSLGGNVDFLRGMAGLNLLYRKDSRTMLSEGKHTDFVNRSMNVTARLNGRIGESLNWQYQAGFALNQMEVRRRKVQDLGQWKHLFSVFVFPVRSFQVQVAGEYYRNEVVEALHKDMILLDSKLTYNLSRSLELSATLSNVFNKKTFGYTLYNDISSSTYEHRLRGREFLISLYWKK